MSRSLFRTKTVSAETAEHGLARSLGVLPLTMLGVGATIGTGIFFVMSEAVPKAGPGVLVAFLVAGVTAILTAMCYAELASSIPASGSAYSYVYVTMGEFPAFLVAACLVLEYGVAASATAIGWSGYLQAFFQQGFGWSLPLALRSPTLEAPDAGGVAWHLDHVNLPPMLLVALCAVLLCRGASESARANTIMVFLKLAVLAFFSFIAFRAFDAGNLHPFMSHGMGGVTAAAGTVFFTFVGLDTVSTGSFEARNPKRDVPRATLAAAAIVMVFYVVVALAALGAQPAAKFAGQDAGLAVILLNVTGMKWPALVLSAGAVISVFSVTLVTLYGQTRILFTMSNDGLAPKLFSEVSRKRRVPAKSSILVCTLVALVAGTVDSNFLWDTVSLGTLLAFFTVSLSIPILRKRKSLAAFAKPGEGFRLPFGPWAIPLLSAAACVYVVHDLPNSAFIAAGTWLVLCCLWYGTVGVRSSVLARRAAA
ncbi:MAG TPA: amino acid permease [Burkholderiaceae bacterium]